MDILTEPHVRGAPGQVVEVLSPGTRRLDEGIKHRLYDRFGVREYWMVDPAGRSIAFCRRDLESGLAHIATLTAAASDVLTTPAVGAVHRP